MTSLLEIKIHPKYNRYLVTIIFVKKTDYSIYLCNLHTHLKTVSIPAHPPTLLPSPQAVL